jgi:hypothetical protein
MSLRRILFASRVLKNYFNAIIELLFDSEAGGAARHRLATSERPEVREVAMSGGAVEFLPLLLQIPLVLHREALSPAVHFEFTLAPASWLQVLQ